MSFVLTRADIPLFLASTTYHAKEHLVELLFGFALSVARQTFPFRATLGPIRHVLHFNAMSDAAAIESLLDLVMLKDADAF